MMLNERFFSENDSDVSVIVNDVDDEPDDVSVIVTNSDVDDETDDETYGELEINPVLRHLFGSSDDDE
jgi:hypothetical protein